MKLKEFEKSLLSSTKIIERTITADELRLMLDRIRSDLDVKKKSLQDRAKLDSLLPEVVRIGEYVQMRVEEIDRSPVVSLSLEDQNASMEELETTKKQLENVIGEIPSCEESIEIRQTSCWQLGRIDELLARLRDAVGNRVTAIAAFKALEADTMEKLSRLEGLTEMAFENSVPLELMHDQLQALRNAIEMCAETKAKLASISNDDLDRENRQAKEQLANAVDVAAERFKRASENVEAFLASRMDTEKLFEDGNLLIAELQQLVRDGWNILTKSDTTPNAYAAHAVVIEEPVKRAKSALSRAAKDERFDHLRKTINEAEEVRDMLEKRKILWDEFIQMRDTATDKLDEQRATLVAIEEKEPRPIAEALKDHIRLKDIKQNNAEAILLIIEKMKSISEELHPLEIAYAEVRSLVADSDQTEQQCRDVLHLIETEMVEEKDLIERGEQIIKELNDIRTTISLQPTRDEVAKVINELLPSVRAKIDFFKANDDDAKESRIHVQRTPEPLVEEYLTAVSDISSDIDTLIKNIADSEKEQKEKRIQLLRSNFEKLRLTADESEEEALRGRIEAELRLLAPDEECTKQLSEELS
ncbi:hypothetical protein AB6A40_011263, partial [Gnathostoma spinigerum]